MALPEWLQGMQGLSLVSIRKKKGKKEQEVQSDAGVTTQLGFDLAALKREEQLQLAWDLSTPVAEGPAPETVPSVSPSVDSVATLSSEVAEPGVEAPPESSEQPEEAEVGVTVQESVGVRRTKPVQNTVVDDGRRNFRITDADALGAGGSVEKAEANLAAIETVRSLEEEGRHATEQEQKVLVKYVGWGGLSQVFTSNLWGLAPAIRRMVEAVQAKLKAKLSEKEYREAQASTTSAFYTPVPVIRAIFEGLRYLGFNGGNLLEPAMGTGNFFGAMPEEMAQASTPTGVEIDPITGRIAQELYPQAHIQVCGYETAVLREDHYDLAVGNVPFGNYQVYDPEFQRYGFLIHDYFFAKTAVKHLREGGLLVFLTSKGTLDKKVLKLRRLLHDCMDLVGAIRLPSSTFTSTAGTDVVSDIVILRKRCKGETPNGVNWLNTKAVEVKDYPVGYDYYRNQEVNEFFADHPEMILGRMKVKKSQYGVDLTVESDGRDLEQAIVEAFRRLPEGVYQSPTTSAENTNPASSEIAIPAPGDAREFSFVIQGDKVYRCEKRNLLPLAMSPKTADRIRGMIQIRDAARQVLRVQLDGCDDATLQMVQWRLNSLYDTFVKKYGYLNSTANRRAYAGDPDEPFVMALEHWDDEDKRATKADIFHSRTLGKIKKVEAVGTPKEALLVSLNELGRISWARMAELTSRPAEELQAELRGEMVFLNPTTGKWETREEYLSGNVRAKLQVAESAAQRDPQYQENVDALLLVQPTDLKPSEISVRIGSPWIPEAEYLTFSEFMFGQDHNRTRVKITFQRSLSKWKVEITDWRLKSDLENISTWGTNRVPGHELLEMALNQQVATVRDEVEDAEGRPRYVINQTETIAAREKMEQMQDKFVAWIWSDEDRATRLAKLYNERFNSHRARVYDGSHLQLPGTATTYHGKSLTLRPHQKDGAWRMICGVNTLLAHKVGAGKTWTLVAGIMERRRLGLTHKALLMVPNHLVGQWASEFIQLYPSARILAATSDDFEASNRKTLFNRIATGDWDAVIVAHSSFQKIPMSRTTVEQFFQEQIDELEDAIHEANDRSTVKQLERTKKQLTVKMEKMLDSASKDDVLKWEEMGIDLLATDEAHEFKNLFYVSRMPRMAGLPQTASNKAFDLFLKARSVQERGGLVTFATGTPVSNTMAEVYTMQRYLQLERLQALDLDVFDRWAANFGKAVTTLEVSPDGGGFRMNTRFAQFCNVPELLLIFKEVCDVRTADMLNLPVPKVIGGDAVTIAAEPSEALKRYVQSLVKRAEAIRNGNVKPDEDNMLAVTGDGRKAAMDMRLIYQGAEDYEGSKVNLMIKEALEIWKDTAHLSGVQLIFSDLGTPTNDGRFSVYADIRTELVNAGVPESEIAFIHDANTELRKEELFRNVRAGKVRFLLGSTFKMGSGTNVQDRLVALHHLDAPWRPSDVEQREGRIVRQGNALYDSGLIEGVRVFRYVTRGSFDAYMWQTLEAKARFINQVMKGDASVRQIEDVDAVALSYAEVKALASGNPLVMRKVQVDTEVRKYSTLKAQFLDSRRKMSWDAANLPTTIRKLEADKEAALKDIEARQDTSEDRFSLVLQGVRYTDRKDAALALWMHSESIKKADGTTFIGTFAGFRFGLTRQLGSLIFVLLGEGQYTQPTDAKTADGLLRSLEGMPLSLEKVVAYCDREIEAKQKRLADLLDHMNQPFEHEEKLAELLREQAEINSLLDLDKSDRSAAAVEAAEVSDAVA